MLFKQLQALILVLCVSVGVIGQEPTITGPDEASINQPVWFTLDLTDGATGKFDDKNTLLDTKPEHVAPGVAMFYATVPGEYRIVAVSVIEKEISFLEKIISIKGNAPPTLEDISAANVKLWLQTIPIETRNESMTNPLTQEVMSKQKAIGQTFLNIGKAADAIGTIPGLELMLSTALTPVLGSSAAQWQEFANKIDAGLAKLKEGTVSDYAKAYITIGEVLINE
jgi:hypothetical protein